MTYAFLFLTYDNPLYDLSNINNNIYIHPKYPSKVNHKYRKYIIKNLIHHTKWCDYSIVEATLNLLKEALDNDSNRWFILLSEDTYPMYNNDEFVKQFNNIHQDRSIFNYKYKYKYYYKTSQWWILNRSDAEIIINNKIKYSYRFQYRIQDGCPDEYFFLSILMWENPHYEFTNKQIMYDKWLEYTIQKNPIYFNNLLR